MNKKYEILNFNLKELDLLERHLNKMAKNHWHLKWISNYIICYEYNENQIHYYIDYNQFSFYDKDKEENRIEEQNQINFYEDLGYEFVCSFDHYVIYKSEEKLEEIHTNEEIKTASYTYVQSRTNRYNFYILLGYALFLFLYFYGMPREAIFSFFDYTYPTIGVSLFITIYFAIQNHMNKRLIDLKDIKRRSINHFILKLIHCILLYVFIINFTTRVASLGIIIAYYCVYNVSNLLYFQSTDKQYKYVPFITNKLPYIIAVIPLIFGIFTYEQLHIYDSYNADYPQEIIQTDFFMINPRVTHYNEKESIALHMIECQIAQYSAVAEYNEHLTIYYHEDKTNLLRPLILYYDGTLIPEKTKTMNDIEIRYKRKYDTAHITFIKDNQYAHIKITEEYTEETINNLINSINWK